MPTMLAYSGERSLVLGAPGFADYRDLLIPKMRRALSEFGADRYAFTFESWITIDGVKRDGLSVVCASRHGRHFASFYIRRDAEGRVADFMPVEDLTDVEGVAFSLLDESHEPATVH